MLVYLQGRCKRMSRVRSLACELLRRCIYIYKLWASLVARKHHSREIRTVLAASYPTKWSSSAYQFKLYLREYLIYYCFCLQTSYLCLFSNETFLAWYGYYKYRGNDCQLKLSWTQWSWLFLIAKSNKEVPCQLKAEPTASHTRSNFQKVRHYSSEKPPQAFLRDDNPHSVPNWFILIAHSRHRVYLETTSQDITMTVLTRDYKIGKQCFLEYLQWVCASLSYSPWDSTC